MKKLYAIKYKTEKRERVSFQMFIHKSIKKKTEYNSSGHCIVQFVCLKVKKLINKNRVHEKFYCLQLKSGFVSRVFAYSKKFLTDCTHKENVHPDTPPSGIFFRTSIWTFFFFLRFTFQKSTLLNSPSSLLLTHMSCNMAAQGHPLLLHAAQFTSSSSVSHRALSPLWPSLQ